MDEKDVTRGVNLDKGEKAGEGENRYFNNFSQDPNGGGEENVPVPPSQETGSFGENKPADSTQNQGFYGNTGEGFGTGAVQNQGFGAGNDYPGGGNTGGQYGPGNANTGNQYGTGSRYSGGYTSPGGYGGNTGNAGNTGYSASQGYGSGNAYPGQNYQNSCNAADRAENNVFSTLSLVCGIVGIVGSCCCLGIPLGIAGIIFFLLSKKGYEKYSGVAIAGLVTSIVGLVLTLLFIGIGSLFGDSLSDYFDYYPYDFGDFLYKDDPYDYGGEEGYSYQGEDLFEEIRDLEADTLAAPQAFFVVPTN